MAVTTDPAARVRRGLRRRSMLFGPIIIAEVALGIAIGIQRIESRGESPPWVFAYLAVGPILVAIFLLSFRFSGTKMVTLVEDLGPRVRSADYRLRRDRGLLVAFDNGVILQLIESNLIFHLFIGPDGTPLRPSVEDVLGWTKVRGPPSDALNLSRLTTPVGLVTNKQSDYEMGTRLEGLRANLGARWALLGLRERRADKMPGGPQWEAAALLQGARAGRFPPMPRLWGAPGSSHPSKVAIWPGRWAVRVDGTLGIPPPWASGVRNHARNLTPMADSFTFHIREVHHHVREVLRPAEKPRVVARVPPRPFRRGRVPVL